MQKGRFDPWVGKIPWRREWLPTPVFLPSRGLDRGPWWAIIHGVATTKRTVCHFLCLSVSAGRGHGGRDGSCLSEEASDTLPTPWSWSSGLQHCEKSFPVVSATHQWDLAIGAQTGHQWSTKLTSQPIPLFSHSFQRHEPLYCPRRSPMEHYSQASPHCQGDSERWGLKTPSYHLFDNTQCELCWFGLLRKQTLI